MGLYKRGKGGADGEGGVTQPRAKLCPICGGTGRVVSKTSETEAYYDPCTACGNRGWVVPEPLLSRLWEAFKVWRAKAKRKKLEGLGRRASR